MSEASYLTLGWQVSGKKHDPRYWLTDKPELGSQSKDDLVRIPSDLMASHTAIIAQSGGGKSFFIGRLIEEILLNTCARCLVIDPNGDFRKVNEVASEDLWKNAAYIRETFSGKLPHESSRDEFLDKWNTIPIRIRVAGSARKILGPNPQVRFHTFDSLKVKWTALNIDILAEGMGQLFRSNLFHCHEFVRAFEALSYLTKARHSKDLLSEAEKLIQSSRSPRDTFRLMIEATFPYDAEYLKRLSNQSGSAWEFFQNFRFYSKILTNETIIFLKNQLLSSSVYISEEVQNYYFAKAREYMTAEILDASIQPAKRIPVLPRLDVIDLPSLRDKSTRLLAISAVLEAEWKAARESWTKAMKSLAQEDQRVPTFIVIDEAHNLIPAEPPGQPEAALRDQFRMIVAEGRKYGLFLVLASQRPDKLDRMVISECDNISVMRINSASVIEELAKMLGANNIMKERLEKCREFETGRVLLTGAWVPDGPDILYTAARRTIEGGRNLRTEHWAKEWVAPKPDSPLPLKVIRRSTAKDDKTRKS